MRDNAKFDFNADQVLATISPFGIHLSPEQLLMILEYVRILLKWNNLISLTSIVEPTEIIARHFGESMFASSVMPVEKGRLADVGAGAGFPGLALKILNPWLQVTLIESNKKKCAFLLEIVRALELLNVEILPERFENIRAEPGFANFVTCRALGGFPALLRWSKRALSHRGHMIFWVGADDSAKISGLEGWTWQPAVRIPESQRRFILVGRPIVSDTANL
jgi:16S rRNA (guanine527-N7)-methyltransferase